MPAAIEDLVLYKRHNPTCAVHKTRVPKAHRRFWMDCLCPIWIYGQTPEGDLVPRQTTNCKKVEDAEKVRAALTKQTQPVTADQGLRIEEVIAKYLGLPDRAN